MKCIKLSMQEETADFLSKLPLVEIVGRSRILIENHQGISTYSPDEIQVLVPKGSVLIKGSDLHLLQMCKAQLVICGDVAGVQLLGGK